MSRKLEIIVLAIFLIFAAQFIYMSSTTDAETQLMILLAGPINQLQNLFGSLQAGKSKASFSVFKQP